ncbi:hypothetical protein C8N35_10358 [Breoghania corrubedonensis]|uniref:Uncharacterized protein n=1 Tax=Breoghania corrubedonensis TaxID=665038 RepID=A0A2T5VAU9_9HYPH|nr:hypothetical protein [Breoghania corrubedonensis]PTW60879.1 hypothetical protein C8N35_10358 [Breoghania corrubedonensis]
MSKIGAAAVSEEDTCEIIEMVSAVRKEGVQATDEFEVLLDNTNLKKVIEYYYLVTEQYGREFGPFFSEDFANGALAKSYEHLKVLVNFRIHKGNRVAMYKYLLKPGMTGAEDDPMRILVINGNKNIKFINGREVTIKSNSNS